MIMSTNKKKDFIETIASMSPSEINDFIKEKGKPPKHVRMCRIIDKEKEPYKPIEISSNL